MANKTECNEKLFQLGVKMINHIYPPNTWRNAYARWRWWFVCSNHYKTRMKPWFERMLQKYEGKLYSRGWLIHMDYWLCWLFLGAEPDNYFDFEFFKKGWRWRNHHITKQRTNFFDPIFNEEENLHLIKNKVDFYRYWDAYIKRKWCIPQQTEWEEFCTLFADTDRILVKNPCSYGGIGIYGINLDASNLKSTYDMLHSSDEELIVEEFVKQKGFLHEVYPTALNPIRVTTVRIKDQIDICYSFFTTGCKGNIISNDCSGGISFSIDTKTGKLGMGQGFSSNGYKSHPDTGVVVAGQYMPDWDRIKEFACEAHKLAPIGLNLIGWDICWNDGELSLIEGNRTPGFPEIPAKHEDQWKMMREYLDLLDQMKTTNS